MGRRIPQSLEANNVPFFFHPVLVLSLAVAWIVASITIVTSLCASCHRKRASSKSPSKPPSPHSNDAPAATVEVSERNLQAPSPAEQEEEEEEEGRREIERMPEAAAAHGPILPTVVLRSSTSKRKLSISLSTKLPQRIRSKREKAASEDSIWKKTIILGEKCRVPDNNDDDDDERNRQRTYHPRALTSEPVSRNTSFTNPSEVPS